MKKNDKIEFLISVPQTKPVKQWKHIIPFIGQLIAWNNPHIR